MRKISIYILFSIVALALNAQRYTKEAMAAFDNQRHDDAITLALQVLDKHPNYEQALWICSVAYYHIGDYSQSLEYKHKLVERFPRNTVYLSNLGATYSQLGYDSIALVYINKAIRYAPSYYLTPLANRASLHARQRRIDEAIEDYNEVKKLAPEDKYVYHNLGIMYEYIEEYDKALEYANISLNNNRTAFAIKLVEDIKAKIDKNYKTPRSTTKEMLSLSLASLNKNRWDASTTLSVAECYDALGKKQLAAKYYKQTIKLVDEILADIPEACLKQQLRAEAYAGLNEKEKALADYYAVSKRIPRDKIVKEEIEKLLSK